MKLRYLLLPLIAILLPSCGGGDDPNGTASGGTATGANGNGIIEDPIAEAKRLLAEAGYPNGEGFPEFELLYNTSESHKKIAAAIQSMWKTKLGIRVTLANSEWKTYLDQLSKLDYQIARRGWIGDYNDPYTFLEMFLTGGGNNNTGWSSKEYDRLIKDSLKVQDKAERRKMLEDAERILMDELPALPIYFYVTQEMYRDVVKGWYQNLQAVHPLKSAYRSDGKTLIINNHTDIQTVDPGIARGVPEHRVQNGLYEGLLVHHPKTLEPIPGVAHKWEVSDDGLTYTFHLRDATWSDGKPVTAHDFEYSWKRVLDPKTASDYAHIMHYIEGAEAYNHGDVKNADGVHIKALDDKTLEVKLANPLPFFLDLMTFFTYYPVRKDLIEKHKNKWTLPENHVGNGAFKLQEWIPNDHITLVKNDKYWDAANVKQKEIRFLPTEDISTAYNLYKSEECDILTTVPLQIVEELMKRDDYHSDVRLGTYYYSFNVKKKPFDDVRVRKALALAIDRKILCDKVIKGGQKPAYHYVPPVFPGFKHPRFDRK